MFIKPIYLCSVLAGSTLFLGACQPHVANDTPANLSESKEIVEDRSLRQEVVHNYQPAEVLPAVGDESSQPYGDNKPPLENPPIPGAEEIEAIRKLVLPQINTVGVPASNRDVWSAFVSTAEGKQLILTGEQQLKADLPELTRELWLLFETTGDRRKYQDAFSERMNRLADLALAEALEYKGRFLPAIESNIRAILEQGAWSVPAHGKSLEVFEGNVFVVDLAAAQLSWSLATVDYWLADVLDPKLRQQIKAEMDRRVLNPYLNAIRSGRPLWWMIRPNNWMAVCTGAVTGAALTIEPDAQRRAEFIANAQIILERYIKGFNSDGISEEGISYWSFGFSHYLYASEAIRRTTGGAIDLMANEHTLIVSQSPLNLEIMGNVYGAFGDQSISAKADLGICNFAAMRYGKGGIDSDVYGRINSGRRHPLSPQLYSLIVFAFGKNAPLVEGYKITEQDQDSLRFRSWFPESELYIFRSGNEDLEALGLAFRIGHNDEYHNHNDIGSFVVARSGQPVLIDPGMERYTKNSFSSKRYDIPLNNSFGHPVPLVGNRMQKKGFLAKGEVLSVERSPEQDSVVVDLTEAYRTPDLVQLIRKVDYLRPSGRDRSKIIIRDEVHFRTATDFSTALITKGNISILDHGVVEFDQSGAKVYAQVETGGQPIAFHETPVTGFSTPASRGLKRLGIYLSDPVKEAYIQITITPDLPSFLEANKNP